MNERIKELADQAWQYADKYSHDGDGRHGHLYRNKFAELIVQECCSIVLNTEIETNNNAMLRGEIASRLVKFIKEN
jgi:hypothetical protein